MMNSRFGWALCAVVCSIVVKFAFIYSYGVYWVYYMKMEDSDQESKIKSVASFVSVLSGLLVVPNLICSFVSIGFSTGLNKKFLEILTRYPAAWILPICTFFVIGPRKLSCDSANEQRRHLVLSRGLTIVNMMITWIMGAIMFVLIVNQIRSFVTIIAMILFLPITTFGHIIFLFPKAKCCVRKFTLVSDRITSSPHYIQALDVSQNELRPFKIHDLA